jgi:ribosomal protein S6--L-glutamate ligase
VLVLGDEVAGAMELEPKPGEFRANVHLEGRGCPVSLTEELKTLATESANALGLQIAGVDILIDENGVAKVIELNYSPGFEGLEAATGADVATDVIRHIVKTCTRVG